MNRTILLLVATVTSAAILVPTGAIPFAESGPDQISEDIEMAPADTPNGGYAVLNENDEIELLLTDANPYIDGAGVDADAVTPIDCVFTMTYTGDSSAEVWLTDDAEDVRFYRDTDPEDSLERSENSVVLRPNESVSVGLLVDTRGNHDVEEVDTFTVHAELAEQRDRRNDRGNDGSNGRNDVGENDNNDDAGLEDRENEDVRNEAGGASEPSRQTPASPTATPDQTPGADADGETAEATDETGTAVTDEGDTAPSGNAPAAGEPTELGGFSPGPLGLVVGSLAAVLLGLAAFRALG
ncbi:hypothetical protein [Haloarcula nitratireducens]|uniref:DUF1102 domain-containing protein n=1 Tax=Haloarcula nitratireducens TaxID=2487749 RepID=A0AAW4PBS7_9EURY|nr:hypothetical protein [Halomicroarcula nitratireducens]MBX0295309.1 hypothetical protein [Halomicroarcula nitratireducens]